MELKTGNFKKGFIDGVCGFFILLWVYAATAKLVEFEAFSVQLGQSPLLSAYAGVLVWLVPLSEYILSILLLFSKTRKAGLLGSLSLMTAFTTYIVIILNFADFVPCSCGGILEALGWTEHLIFNGVCLLLAATAFLVASQKPRSATTGLKRNVILKLFAGLFGSPVLVIVLFLTSEEQTHRNNAFVRRYPQHIAEYKAKLNLGFNSYYIAGITKDSIYLGNTTAPLHLLAIDSALQDTVLHRLDIPDSQKYSFRSLKVQVLGKRYYLSDGSVPVIFTDTLGTWRPAIVLKDQFPFYKMVAMGDSAFAVLTASTKTGEHELGLLKFKDSISFQLVPELLEKQIDGKFDVDGFLEFNQSLKKLLYVYRYRNDFLVINDEFHLDYRGKTIDTLAKAQLDIAVNSNQIKLGPKTTRVNLNAANSGTYLFIRSDRLGQYEPKEMLDEASIIDVYNIEKQSYLLSFYLYDEQGHKMRDFGIREDRLYSLQGNYIIKNRLKANAVDF